MESLANGVKIHLVLNNYYCNPQNGAKIPAAGRHTTLSHHIGMCAGCATPEVGVTVYPTVLYLYNFFMYSFFK